MSYFLNLLNSLKSSHRWFLTVFTPYLNKQSLRVVSVVTRESGAKYWSGLVPSKKWNLLIIRTLVGLSGITIVWAIVASVDESVQATGKLEPTGSTLPIRAPIGGVVKEILVSDGDSVLKGQRVIEMDTTSAKARLAALTKVRDQILAEILLSKAQLGHKIDITTLSPNQLTRLKSLKSERVSRLEAFQNTINQSIFQLESLQANLDANLTSLALRESALSDIKPLVEQGAISKIQFTKELGEVTLLRGKVKSIKSDLKRQHEVVAEAKNKLKNASSLSGVDFSTKLDESQKQLAQINNQLSEVRVTLGYQTLVSPANGLVFDLRPASPGFVVTGEDPVLKIVPTDVLVARAYITNRDIGFIRRGQIAKVRVDAYPYNEFGELTGEVVSIGSDVLEPDANFNYYRFPVTIKLDKTGLVSRGKNLPLLSGMSVSVNIVLRKRPVISLFTEQILPFWSSLEQL